MNARSCTAEDQVRAQLQMVTRNAGSLLMLQEVRQSQSDIMTQDHLVLVGQLGGHSLHMKRSSTPSGAIRFLTGCQ